MSIRRALFSCFSWGVLALGGAASAQVTPCAAFGPEPPPCTTPASRPAGAIASLDGEYLLLADLDPKVRELVEGLDKAVAEARRKALRREVERLLAEREATRRHVAAKVLHHAEVEGCVVPPSDGEIQAEVTAHADKYSKKPEWAQRQARMHLLDERLDRLHEELLASLSKETAVTFGADAGDSGLAPDAVLATVRDRKLTFSELSGLLETAAVRSRLLPWYREKSAVEALVHERLAKKEAARRGVTVEELEKAEVAAKIKSVSDAEVAASGKELAYWFGSDPQRARDRAAEYLKEKREQEAEEAFDKRLREGHDVKLLFDEPKSPRQAITMDGSPARGPSGTPVTLVEFGDFECPPCGYMSGVVEEALKGREKSVRYVFRQNPLPFHPFAAKAAEAALAAHAQGRFFAYARLLFANQKALDVASLERYALEAGLDRDRFVKDLESGRFAADVGEDLRDGERYGVLGTPAFFLDGVPLFEDAYTVEGMRAALDRAIAERERTASR